VNFKSFIIPKVDKDKTINLEKRESFYIDVNSWFKSNSLTPSNMNEVRQYIFEEWLYKKISGSKSKLITGSNLVIIYDSPTDPFISLLKEKISDVFNCDFCEVILITE
jgi:hypothetical protein